MRTAAAGTNQEVSPAADGLALQRLADALAKIRERIEIAERRTFGEAEDLLRQDSARMVDRIVDIERGLEGLRGAQ
jgi:dsDNA-specific endonuclease/ATPase MutS2